MNQHKNDIKKFKDKTGLSTHAIETGHAIQWQNTKIVETEINNEKRLFLETAHIISDPNNLNLQSDYTGHNTAYRNILLKFK